LFIAKIAKKTNKTRVKLIVVKISHYEILLTQ